MNLIQSPLIAQTLLAALLGLSMGYHISQAFREIETWIGEPAFMEWLKKAIKQATHHYDIGLAGMILGISIYIGLSPFSRINISVFVFFMFMAGYWDDRADAPPKDLIRFAIQFLENKIIRRKIRWDR